MVGERHHGAELEGRILMALVNRDLAKRVVVVDVLCNAESEVVYKEAMPVVAVSQTRIEILVLQCIQELC